MFASQLVEELVGVPEHLLVAMHPGTTSNQLDVPSVGRSRFDLVGFFRLVRMARKSDVLVAHRSDALLHCAAVGTLTRTPFIYRNIGDPSVWRDVRFANVRIGLPLRRARTVVALYHKASDQLIAAYSLDPDRVVVIPNAVPWFPEPTPEKRTRMRPKFELGDELSWVGFVGSLSKCQGSVRLARCDHSSGSR